MTAIRNKRIIIIEINNLCLWSQITKEASESSGGPRFTMTTTTMMMMMTYQWAVTAGPTLTSATKLSEVTNQQRYNNDVSNARPSRTTQQTKHCARWAETERGSTPRLTVADWPRITPLCAVPVPVPTGWMAECWVLTWRTDTLQRDAAANACYRSSGRRTRGTLVARGLSNLSVPP